MIKLLLSLFLVSSLFGGCSQMEQVVDSKTTTVGNSVEQTILSHVEQNYSLKPSEVSIKRVTPENLPSSVSQFYVEKKSSYGNIYYNYLVQNDQLYTSGNSNDFGRFLKDNDFLNKTTTDIKQFLAIFRVLKFKNRDVNILNKETLAAPSDKLKLFINQLSAPKLTIENGNANFVFFTKKIVGSEVRKWEVNVSPNYEVVVNNEVLEKST